MEAASSLGERRPGGGGGGLVNKVPFARVLGPEIGAMFRALHEEKGVHFEAEAEVTALLGEAGRVTGVQLKTGRVLPADAVVLGRGRAPGHRVLQDAFPLKKTAAWPWMPTCKRLKTCTPPATLPGSCWGPPACPRALSIRRPSSTAGTAARNMLGQRRPSLPPPVLLDAAVRKELALRWPREKWDEIIYHGDVAKQDFLALYVLDGRLIAAASMNRDADMIHFAERLEQGQLPAPAAVHEGMSWASATT
ncbi:MAG: FAD-dependent oxidoreductase [Hymenobacter sp.]